MKHIIEFLLLASVILVGACGQKTEKKTFEDSLTLMPGERLDDGIVQLDSICLSDTVNWRGHRYEYRIVRVPAPDLPQIRDEETLTAYMDNRISLTVKCNGAEIFNKVFTKADFFSYLDDRLRKNGILDGLVFGGTSPEGLRFGTGISYPQSDSSVSLLIIISSNGGLSITKDELMESDHL